MLKNINHIVMQDGSARIAGKEHIKAEMVARMYVGTDYEIADVMAQYELTEAEVHAALVYYYDNRVELDARHAEITSEIRENAMTLGTFKKKLANDT